MNGEPIHRTKEIVSLLTLAALLAGCAKQVQQPAPVMGTIINVAKDQTRWGCVGTDWSTYVQPDKGPVIQLCGQYGPVGTRIRVTPNE